MPRHDGRKVRPTRARRRRERSRVSRLRADEAKREEVVEQRRGFDDVVFNVPSNRRSFGGATHGSPRMRPNTHTDRDQFDTGGGR